MIIIIMLKVMYFIVTENQSGTIEMLSPYSESC